MLFVNVDTVRSHKGDSEDNNNDDGSTSSRNLTGRARCVVEGRVTVFLPEMKVVNKSDGGHMVNASCCDLTLVVAERGVCLYLIVGTVTAGCICPAGGAAPPALFCANACTFACMCMCVFV